MQNPLHRRLLYTFIPSIFILLIVVCIKIFINYTFHELFSDVWEIAKVHPFVGIVSNLGILLWCATTSVLFLTAYVLKKHLSRSEVLFLISSGLFSGYLLFDDVFSFHELLAPNYLHINEDIVYLIILLAAIIYFVKFFRIIYSSKYFIFLIIAISFLGFSLISDSTPVSNLIPPLGDWRHLIEEGTKWIGICGWSSYFILTSITYVKDNLKSYT